MCICVVCVCVHACASFLYRYNPLCPELVLECYHTVSILLQYICELDVCCVLVYYCIHLDVCKWGQSKLVTLDLTLSFHIPFHHDVLCMCVHIGCWCLIVVALLWL